jgi:exportin-2 (importin alpha re-exporter)
LAEADVTAIKREIIGLMISVPINLQVQLGEATSIIAESDFFERWDTLVDVSLVSAVKVDPGQVRSRSSRRTLFLD